jgi:hypothetical protein
MKEYEIAIFYNNLNNVIGSGGFGILCKAVLHNGQLVVVEKLGCTNKNQPKCNHSIYDYMRLVVVCD